MIKNHIRYAVAAAFFLASGATNVAFAAVLETEDPPNDSIASAQRLIIGDTGIITVTGVIGVPDRATPVKEDTDFYSFHGRAGDVVRIDIDGGIKSSTTLRSLNALIAIFKPDDTVLRQRNDVLPTEVDEGSIARFDPHIENVHLPVTGVYTVGVTSDASYPDRTMRVFLTGGATTPFVPSSVSNGSYTLIIEGVSPSAIQISIDVKPGADSIAPINPKAKGKIPVALLSAKDRNDPSKDFDALKADRDSIRFGPTGTEAAGRCGKNGEDVNRDGLLDLVCHFETQDARLDESDPDVMVTGTIGGMPFEGRGWLKAVPVKRED